MHALVLNPPREIATALFGLPQKLTVHRASFASVEILFNRTETHVLVKGEDIRNYDFVWISASWTKRDVAYAISLYLQHHGRKHTIVHEGQGNSKLVDMMHYALHQLPQPRSYYCTKFSYRRNADAIIKACGLPLLAKDVRGTYGRNTYLAQTKEELLDVLRSNPNNTDYIFQEYIEHDFDWGILVGNQEVLAAERTYRPANSTSFMNHDDPGIYEVFEKIAKVPADINQIALKANTILGLNWGRSDIVFGKNDHKPYILETNRSPRISPDTMEVQAYGHYLNSLLQDAS